MSFASELTFSVYHSARGVLRVQKILKISETYLLHRLTMVIEKSEISKIMC